MKEKIIQIVPIQGNFWGRFQSTIMLLTDKGSVYLATANNTNFRKMKDLPEELQSE